MYVRKLQTTTAATQNGGHTERVVRKSYIFMNHSLFLQLICVICMNVKCTALFKHSFEYHLAHHRLTIL
jgi:hypothetical protein